MKLDQRSAGVLDQNMGHFESIDADNVVVFAIIGTEVYKAGMQIQTWLYYYDCVSSYKS